MTLSLLPSLIVTSLRVTRRSHSIENIFFWTKYKYEYIQNFLFHTNTNFNIFQDHIFDRIQTGSNRADFLHAGLFLAAMYMFVCVSLFFLLVSLESIVHLECHKESKSVKGTQQGRFKEVSRVFQESFKTISRKFQ